MAGYLDALNLPPDTMNRMVETRNTTSVHEAHAGHVSVTWSYRAGGGLEAIFRTI